jgi:hypothetical protein
MAIRKKITFEGRIALLAVFTSIGALCISGYQAYMQRLQTYASVLPSLTTYTSTNYNSNGPKGNTFEFVLENKGVGPAKIDSVVYFYQDSTYKYLSDVVNKISTLRNFGTNELWNNKMISSNERISIITLNDSLAKQFSEKFIQTKSPEKLSLIIHYSSIFGEKWILKWTNLDEQRQSNEKL